jgi:hypothetical protein
MRGYIFGFISGLATYHFILGGSNQELVTEMRGWVKSVDERLAEAERKTHRPENTPGTPTEPSPTYRPTPPDSPSTPPAA